MIWLKVRRSAMQGAPPKGLVRSLAEAPLKPVAMDGVRGVRMAVMVGREDGAPNFALRQFVVEPGGHSPRHSHDYEHEVYIVDGSGTVLLNGAERPIKAGDVVFVPADHEHQFRATAGGSASGLKFLCLVPVTRNCGDPTPGS
jgi:quercetin dioxygenase-like cupin family protein